MITSFENRLSLLRWTSALLAVLVVSVLVVREGHCVDVRPDSPEKTIIAETVKAHGGVDALRKIATVYAEGAIEATMAGDHGTSTRCFARGRCLRIELVYQRSAETRILNGIEGWRGTDGRPPVAVKGAPYLAMVYQYKYLDFPLSLVDGGYEASFLGTESRDGVDVDVLAVNDAEGPPMRVLIDAKTHLVRRVAGQFSMGEASTELAVEFADYRAVDGAMFPFRVVNYGGEFKIAETVITKLRTNEKFKDSLFRPEPVK